MDQVHACKIAINPRLSRLSELMARAGTRRRQAIQMASEATAVKASFPASDPVEALFIQHGDLSIGEVMDMTGQSRTTVHRRLVELVEEGLLERRGEGRASRYHCVHNSKLP